MCIKVYCCSMIEDHQRFAQVTGGFGADFVLLNNVSKQALFCTDYQNDFLNLLFVGDKKRSITDADVHLNTEYSR